MSYVRRRVDVHRLMKLCERLVPWFFPRLMFYTKSCFFDVEYYAITDVELRNALNVWKLSILPRLKYRQETWDCDDFAEYFASWLKLRTKTNCCGVVIGEVAIDGYTFGHAWNAVLVHDSHDVHVVMIEPQLGKVVYPNREHVIDGLMAIAKRRAVPCGRIRYVPHFFVW